MKKSSRKTEPRSRPRPARSKPKEGQDGSGPSQKPRRATAPSERIRPQKDQAASIATKLTPDPTALGQTGATGNFPIVGIGASAGGLEALEQFLRNVPERSGMAFVVIQHLDPTHRGAMVELLQRATRMKVEQAHDEQKVQRDSVYIIPPNKDMSILHGVLHLLPKTLRRGLNLPIDFFFRALAEDQQELSIAVVLSGMGSDGTLGLRAIKEKAGATFVQALTSAKFDGMPRSAIEAGLADVIAPAEELPGRIIAYRRHAPFINASAPDREEKQVSALEKVLILLRTQTGNDFSLYKKSTIYRRIERRMSLHQIDTMPSYVRYLRENPEEIDLLFKELLIGVTSFFRDPPAWEHLANKVLPELLKTRGHGALRAWVAGCSTGEEAYSLAIVLKEAIDKQKPPRNMVFQIFATDLDKEAIETARVGMYPTNIAADISPERLSRFFLQEERGYRIRKEIREMVVFAPQNIIMDPPFTKLDILSCRNLLIYLSPEVQKKLIPLFHYSLKPGGVLFLGSAETIGVQTHLFSPVDGKVRLFRRLDSRAGAHMLDLPSSLVAAEGMGAAEAELVQPQRTPSNLHMVADRVIVQRFSPAAVVTNDKGDILYISGRTGKYLEPAVGKANLNVLAMAREGLRYELNRAFSAAQRDNHPIIVPAVKVETEGGVHPVSLTVQRLVEPPELAGMTMIVLTDVPVPPEPVLKARRRTIGDARTRDLDRDLQQAREEIQTTREEMQTSQEELKSTNEELQSTNEELQSTNEELTTSKEEMQSMNEELQTVNQELQAKVDELSRSNNDMKNLLNSTEIATLFLDGDLLVRRFTSQIPTLIKLIPGDVGRPITDIATNLDYVDLEYDAREVLRTLVFREKDVASHDGRWFKVRILPYRTLENVIDGVVITFTDATSGKLLEQALRDQASQLRQMAESLPNLAWSCNTDGICDYVNSQWVEYTGIPAEEQFAYGWLQQVHPDDRDRVRDEWKKAVKTGTPLNTEFRIRRRDGVFCWFRSGLVPIRNNGGSVVRWYGNSIDVDDLKRAAESREGAPPLPQSDGRKR